MSYHAIISPMIFLLIYIALNIYIPVVTWKTFRKIQKRRGKDFKWEFNQCIDLFLYWIFISSCFTIAFFHTHSIGVFLLNTGMVLGFIILVKIGTADFTYECNRNKRDKPA